VRRALGDFIAAECTERPLVIVLEDLQWGDRVSVSVVEDALDRLRDRPLLVLSFARPEVHEIFPRLWADRELTEIRLRGRSPRAGEELVRAPLGSQVSRETANQLIGRADGNAFYLEELIRTVAVKESASLPDTVVAMAQARLAGLDADKRHVLRAASVFGRV